MPSDWPDPRDPDYAVKVRQYQEWQDFRGRLVGAAVIVGIVFIANFLITSWLLNLILSHSKCAWTIDISEPSSILSLYLRTAALPTLGAMLPIALLQFHPVLAPELPRRERRILFAVAPGALLLFAAGMAIGLLSVAPAAWTLIQGWFWPRISVWGWGCDEVLFDLYVPIMVTIGLTLQLPALMAGVAKLGIISRQGFRSARRCALPIIVLVAAIITATVDPISLLIIALPLYGSYELGIVLASLCGHSTPAESRQPVG
jgi:sec-independent protein translocase protein TatC